MIDRLSHAEAILRRTRTATRLIRIEEGDLTADGTFPRTELETATTAGMTGGVMDIQSSLARLAASTGIARPVRRQPPGQNRFLKTRTKIMYDLMMMALHER